MRMRKEKLLWNVLLGTSVYLLDSLRARLAEGAEDLTDRARDTYGEASRRVSRASNVIRGEDHSGLSTAAGKGRRPPPEHTVHSAKFSPSSGAVNPRLFSLRAGLGAKVLGSRNCEPPPSSRTSLIGCFHQVTVFQVRFCCFLRPCSAA